MKIDFKNINKSKFYMIIGICILCISILGSSIAYYRTVLFDDLTVDTITHGLDYYINYSKGQNISGATLELSSDYSSSAANTSITFYKKDNTYDIYGHIYLDVNEIGSYVSTSNGLKYTLENNYTVVAEGTLKGSSSGDSILVKSNIPLEVTEQVYTIYIWLDENEDISSEAENETLSLTVRCEATMKPLTENLVTYINNLYMNNKDATPVTNNGIEYTYASIYDKDTDSNTSGGLMNDRLGGVTSNYDAGNIRYYGKNPLNYIDIGDVYTEDVTKGNWEAVGGPFTTSDECNAYFETENLISMGICTDETSCAEMVSQMLASMGFSTVDEICEVTTIKAGTPKLYRIIGLFKDVEKSDGTTDDLVKIIRDDIIGNYSWDQSASDVNNGYGINEWNQADLMKLLNPTFESETVGGSLYWNSGIGNCYGYDNNTGKYTSIPCDFTQNGMPSDFKNKIEEVKWNLGGHNSSDVYSNQIYGYERGANVVVPGVTCSGVYCNDKVERQTTWTGKVALPYPSDYGYAVDFNSCSKTLYYYYQDEGCYDKDWLYKGVWYWLLTPSSSRANGAWLVGGDGGVRWAYNVNDYDGVLPVLYLDSELVIETGDGSKTTPYVVR